MAEAVQVIWEEPPTRTRANGKYSAFFDALREHPGRWARFTGTKGDSGAAAAIRTGKYVGADAGEFDAVSRIDDAGNKGTWVRFVGKPAAKRRGRPPKDAAAKK